jgi:hypothetical protein
MTMNPASPNGSSRRENVAAAPASRIAQQRCVGVDGPAASSANEMARKVLAMRARGGDCRRPKPVTG